MNPVVLNFSIREGGHVAGEYEGFICLLRQTLADHPLRLGYIQRYGDWLRQHPLLPVQQPVEPPRWIHINLIVQNEDGVEKMRTTIAIRDDNVYFIGFKNQHGQWYEFGTKEKNTRFIAGSTLLGCDMGYRDLVGNSADFMDLSLTKQHLIEAVRRLSGYQEVVPADSATKRDLARICVIICESARMIPHREAVSYRWRYHDPTGISLDQVQNMKDWSKMSSYLLSMLAPSPERTNLLNIVHLLFNKVKIRQAGQRQQEQAPGGGGGSSQQGSDSSDTKRPEMASWPPASGSGSSGRLDKEQTGQRGRKSIRTQPLVQVFEVEAKFPANIGSIVVFDGKRGQIIHKHGSQQRASLYGYELALTGPYKAISADRSFAIQVHSITSRTDASDESTKVIGEMLWDCYADDVVYDKILTRDIINADTRSILARVSYAVWSEAVEATLEVNLLLPGSTSVYGHISARYSSLGHDAVVLFSRNEVDKVELVPSGADSMAPLELGRSVIAVPLQSRYSLVTIYVELHVACPNKEGDVILAGWASFYLDKHEGEIRVQPQLGDITVPGGWTRGSDPAGGIGASRGSQGASGSDSGQGTGQTIVQQGKVQVNITSPGFHVSPLKPESIEHMELDIS